jgi:hypothetical protein
MEGVLPFSTYPVSFNPNLKTLGETRFGIGDEMGFGETGFGKLEFLQNRGEPNGIVKQIEAV